MTRPPTLAQALAILGEIDYQALAADIELHLPSARTASLDPTRSSGNTSANEPTASERRAMQHQDIIEAAIVRIYTAALSISNIQRERKPTRDPGRTAPKNPPAGCKLHTEATGHPGKRYTSTDFGNHITKIVDGETVADPLPNAIPVCSLCYEFVRYHHRLPTPDEIKRHERTGKWVIRVKPRAA